MLMHWCPKSGLNRRPTDMPWISAVFPYWQPWYSSMFLPICQHCHLCQRYRHCQLRQHCHYCQLRTLGPVISA